MAPLKTKSGADSGPSAVKTAVLLGGLWVVISRAMRPVNVGYIYSYPSEKPTFN